MFRKIFLIPFLFATMAGHAQDLKDNFYVKILSEELNRNIQKLHLPDLEKPFFISYRLRKQNNLTIRAERGEIVTTVKTPAENTTGGVKLRVGNYHRNFDYSFFDGSFINLPDEPDVDEYKRIYWMETDRAYKNVSQQYSASLASLKRVNVDEKELALDDMSKITAVVKDFGSLKPINANRQKWEIMLKELSQMFTKYPVITTSYCQLNFNNYEDYLVTSEGTQMRKPGESVTVSFFASAMNEDGSVENEGYSFYGANVDEIPSADVLRGKVNELIMKIIEAGNAKKFENSYLGPVLFMDDAAPALMQNLFGTSLVTRRKSILGYDYGSTDYEDKLGQKLVSTDLTVTAAPKLQYFDGRKVTGSFEIDDDGVIPPDSLVLIGKGLLKSLMNGRTPTQKFPKSQGFARSFTGRNINPGVLKVTSSNTIAADSMKSRLVKLAREEGLKEAYIVKDNNYSTSGLYHIDVATGVETRISNARLSNFSIRSMRRFVTASDQLKLRNTSNLSIIAPESFIVNEVEIEKVNTTVKPKPFIVSNPLLDKKVVSVQENNRKRRK